MTTGTPVVRLAGLTTLLLATLCALAFTTGAQAADRAFSPRFSTNDTGDITAIANTLMTCNSATAGCTAAQNAAPTDTANSALNNNNFPMAYVDTDGDTSTFDSSSATLALPASATVLYAGLYWGGEVTGGSGGSAAPNASARGTVKFRTPGGSYQTLSATTLDDGSIIYQGFKDVTSLVAAAGNGEYTVGNVQTGTGADRLGGWSLVIAYRDTSEPARNLTVFDGLKSIDGSNAANIPVSGFLTPPAGAVKTRVGFITYEGDDGLVGDAAALNGTTLTDATHPANNFFNSHISRDGVIASGKNPDYANQLGFDAAFIKADAILGNNATSATIRVSTAGDVYAPGVITFATEIYAPKIVQTKTVVDDNGGDVEQGDTLTYTVSGTNTGQDGTAGFVLRDPIPANTTYVPGSIGLSDAATPAGTAATDASADDRAEFDAANARVVARLGTGASATSGGNVQPGASYSVSFKVKVGGLVPGGTTISNTATSSFDSATTRTPLTAASTRDVTTVAPDVRIVKTRSGAALVAGGASEYTLAVDNHGSGATHGVISVRDTLPAGLTATAVSGSGWICTAAPTTDVACTRTAPIAAGAAAPGITIAVSVDAAVRGSVDNTATVAADGDVAPADNSSTVSSTVSVPPPPPPKDADVSITKTVDDAAPRGGGTVVYTLTARNAGPGVAQAVTVKDTLPAGLTFVSAVPASCAQAARTVTCNVGDLAAGDSRVVKITATVDPIAGVPHPGATHQLTVNKTEQQLDLDPGQTRTLEIDCGAGQVLTDASVRTDAVDQGTGDLASVYVLSAHGDGVSRYVATVRNAASGRAQAKLFAVCLSATTSTENGHSHDLLVSAPLSAPLVGGVATISCGTGRTPIQPGIDFGTDSARLLSSTPTADGSGWTFTADGPGTASVRCLSKVLSTAGGHTHALDLERRTAGVTVPAGQTAEVQVTCSDDAKGIVADWSVPAGLVAIGNDPRPKTRAFRFFNPTSSDLTATVGLLCLDQRTGPETSGAAASIVNVATVTSATPDPDGANNSGSATITPGAGAAAGPGATVASRSLTTRGSTTAVRVSCAGAGAVCRGTLSIKTLRGGRLDSARFVARAGRTVTVRLRSPALRTLRRVRLTILGSDGRRTGRTVSVRRR